MLLCQLQGQSPKIAMFLSMIEWSLVVLWSVFWTKSQYASRDKDKLFKTSTPKCRTCICSWDKDVVSRMHLRFLSTSVLKKLKMTSMLSRRESFHASWITMTTAEWRKRRQSTRTKCHRESSICSRRRLLRRWWTLSRVACPSQNISLAWSTSE